MAKITEDKPDALTLQKNTSAIELGRLFRDKVYTSRTLILPGGATLPVAQGRVSAVDDAQFQYLNIHPDFEPLTE